MKGGKKEPREFCRKFCRTSGNVWPVWDTMQNLIYMSFHKQGSWPSCVLKSFNEQKCFRAMNFAITETYLDHVPLSAHKQELPQPCWGCCVWSSLTCLEICPLRINLDIGQCPCHFWSVSIGPCYVSLRAFLAQCLTAKRPSIRRSQLGFNFVPPTLSIWACEWPRFCSLWLPWGVLVFLSRRGENKEPSLIGVCAHTCFLWNVSHVHSLDALFLAYHVGRGVWTSY